MLRRAAVAQQATPQTMGRVDRKRPSTSFPAAAPARYWRGVQVATCSWARPSLPTVERMRGSRPFEMHPFMRFLGEQVERLRPFMTERVDMRVALHRHPGVPGVVEAAEKLLRAVPGIELVDLGQPAIGSDEQCARRRCRNTSASSIAPNLTPLRRPASTRCWRSIMPIIANSARTKANIRSDIMNVLDVVGASMGLRQDDHYKRLKLMQDADAILADARDLAERQRSRSRYGARASSSACSPTSRCRCGVAASADRMRSVARMRAWKACGRRENESKSFGGLDLGRCHPEHRATKRGNAPCRKSPPSG